MFSDSVWVVASGYCIGQVDGLGDKVGYQMVWHDVHLLMVVRMIVRFDTHLHVAIRFIFKILYWCGSHNNKNPTGLRR